MTTTHSCIAQSTVAESTTTPGSAWSRTPVTRFLVVGALAISSTSSAEPTSEWESDLAREVEITSGGDGASAVADAMARAPIATREALSELRRLSGLTWEQLGQLFGVSRRSIHFWASGKPLNADNEARLLFVLDIVRTADRGDARTTRAALLDVHDGVSAFELLATEKFIEARTRLGKGVGRPGLRRSALSGDARAARAPLRPEELVGALHDRVHPASGRLLSSTPLKTGGS